MSSTRPVTRYFLAVACAAPLLLAFAPARAQGYPQPPPPPPSGYGQPPAGGYAQPPPPPAAEPPLERRGWFAGFEAGLGSLKADGRFETGEEQGSGQFGAHFGGMISPRMGLMVLFAGAVQSYHDSDGYYDTTLGQVNLGIAVQYWASPKLWLKAGLVSSHMTLDQEGETISEAKGGGILGSIGYEFYRRGRFVMDGRLRFVSASHGEDNVEVSSSSSVGLLLGFSWY